MGYVKTSKVARVKTLNSSGSSRTGTINDPKEGLTLNGIQSAFAGAISGGWLLDNSGEPITSVDSAYYEEVTKTEIEGAEITVSPSEVTVTLSGPADTVPESSTQLTVTGANYSSVEFFATGNSQPGYECTFVRFGNTRGDYQGNLTNVYFKGLPLTGTSYAESGYTLTGKFIYRFSGTLRTVEVPVTITRTITA